MIRETKTTSIQPHQPEAGPSMAAARRRRGTVLILVVTILGILFVTGIAFMATMNFEADIIAAENARTSTGPATESIVADVQTAITEVIPSVTGNLGGQFVSWAANYTEMPGVDNLFAPIEPYVDPITGNMVFAWATDIKAYRDRIANPDAPVNRFSLVPNSQEPVDPTEFWEPLPTTTWDSGKFWDDYTTLDADGDGIIDSIEVPLGDLGAVNDALLDELKKTLNPASDPNGDISAGLRIIAHGGMANLSYSHPLIIDAVIPGVTGTPLFNPPYDPKSEEYNLRRRFFLPPREIQPSSLFGNSLANPLSIGTNDLSFFLLPQETMADHRYYPIDPPAETGADPAFPLWHIRMDPDRVDPVNPDPTSDGYDRRHLVTTISHDDLLARPTIVGIDNGTTIDSLDLADWINSEWRKDIIANGCPAVVPVPYLDYPETVTTSGVAEQYANSYVGINRAGAPQYADWCDCINDPDCELNSLKGRLKLSLPYLDDLSKAEQILLIQDTFTFMLLNARGSDWGSYKPSYLTSPPYWDPNFPVIAETAAALTANMIDFADGDDDPTAVDIRSADYNDPTGFGQSTGTGKRYGIERQPFITEVVVQATDDGTGAVDFTQPYFFGVELFNPYDTDINLNDYTFTLNGGPNSGFSVPFSFGEIIPAGSFVGFYDSDTMMPLPGAGPAQVLLSTISGSEFLIDENTTVALVRNVIGVPIVVDRFSLVGQTSTTVGQWEQTAGIPGTIGSIERVASSIDPSSYWYSVIPADLSNSSAYGTGTSFGDSLGNSVAGNLNKVEVLLANTGSFESAFPTTGSMLLLMRHANAPGKPFTDFLDDQPFYPIDNGRMPVFDESTPDGMGLMLHHADANVDVSATFPATSFLDKPGGLEHLPWGQYVFDYFTALPLSNEGPNLVTTGTNDVEKPKVDMDGMRVHGRININAAPWKVLEGVPFVPMERFTDSSTTTPSPIEDAIATALNISVVDRAKPIPLGPELAKSIVAYRELREIFHTFPGSLPESTGNYNDGSTKYPSLGVLSPTPSIRGWDAGDTFALPPKMPPSMRRGTGFMTVGELANVRHAGASAFYRFDNGLVPVGGTTNTSYIEAVAPLMALSDWITVRSQVFTVYGVLRGSQDVTIEDPNMGVEEQMRIDDVDSRAIRFQETIDRLPMLNGSKEPDRIGDRIMANYDDVQSD